MTQQLGKNKEEEPHRHVSSGTNVSYDTVGDYFKTYHQGQCKCGVLLGSKQEVSSVLTNEAKNRMAREQRAQAAEERKRRSKD